MKMLCTGSWWTRNRHSRLIGPSPLPMLGKGVFCGSSRAAYLFMIGPVAVVSAKQPGMKLSGGFPSRPSLATMVSAQDSLARRHL